MSNTPFYLFLFPENEEKKTFIEPFLTFFFSISVKKSCLLLSGCIIYIVFFINLIEAGKKKQYLLKKDSFRLQSYQKIQNLNISMMRYVAAHILLLRVLKIYFWIDLFEGRISRYFVKFRVSTIFKTESLKKKKKGLRLVSFFKGFFVFWLLFYHVYFVYVVFF